MTGKPSFFAELKRRNVYKVAVGYVVVSWLIIQAASILLPIFEAPAWATKVVVAFLIVGFPVALILSWVFEVTPEGIKRESELPPNESIRHHTGKIVGTTVFLAVLAAALLAFQLFRPKSTSTFQQDAGAARTPDKIIPEKSIAVLPFDNLSDEKANAYFAQGVQGEILTRLTQVADLKVISRTSTQEYQNKQVGLAKIAKQLGVAHILEGSVQKVADQVRVNVQLINAQSDSHLWAETYDRKLTDLFAVESDIAKRIAGSLRAKLSAKEKTAINERPTSDLAAYDLYLQAKELVYQGEIAPAQQRDNIFKAVQLLEQAVTDDPAFLLAHCQLAATHDLAYFFNYDHTESRLQLAEVSIANARRVQPDAGQTHLAQAIHSYWGYLDYYRAREELTKAQQALPNDTQVFKFLGLIDRRQGRWNEAVRNLERVVELDPRNVEGLGNLAQAYFDLRRYADSIAMFDKIAELEPGNPAAGTYRASIELYARADMMPLRNVLNKIEAEGPASAADVAPLSFDLARYERDATAAARAVGNIAREGYTDADSVPYPHAWFEGLLAELRSDATAAQSAFRAARAEIEELVKTQPKNEKPLSVLALIDAHLGEKEQAIHEGRTACDMLPVSADAVSGVLLATNLARVYAVISEDNLALRDLEVLATLPGGPTYGDLRLDPVWDRLRADPHFGKIVASLAPK